MSPWLRDRYMEYQRIKRWGAGIGENVECHSRDIERGGREGAGERFAENHPDGWERWEAQGMGLPPTPPPHRHTHIHTTHTLQTHTHTLYTYIHTYPTVNTVSL